MSSPKNELWGRFLSASYFPFSAAIFFLKTVNFRRRHRKKNSTWKILPNIHWSHDSSTKLCAIESASRIKSGQKIFQWHNKFSLGFGWYKSKRNTPCCLCCRLKSSISFFFWGGWRGWQFSFKIFPFTPVNINACITSNMRVRFFSWWLFSCWCCWCWCCSATPCAPHRTKIVINYYGFTFIDVLKPYLYVRWHTMTSTFVCLTPNCHKHFIQSKHILYTWQILALDFRTTFRMHFLLFSAFCFLSLSLSNFYLSGTTFPFGRLPLCTSNNTIVDCVGSATSLRPSLSCLGHTQKYHNNNNIPFTFREFGVHENVHASYSVFVCFFFRCLFVEMKRLKVIRLKHRHTKWRKNEYVSSIQHAKRK